MASVVVRAWPDLAVATSHRKRNVEALGADRCRRHRCHGRDSGRSVTHQRELAVAGPTAGGAISDAFHATQLRPDCAAQGSSGSEDCLWVSVYIPNGGGTSLSEMVWIHGGASVADDDSGNGIETGGLSATGVIAQPGRAPPERDSSFDEGWLFDRGSGGSQGPGFDDSGWRPLDLPPDWTIEDPPTPRAVDNFRAHPDSCTRPDAALLLELNAFGGKSRVVSSRV